MLTIHTSKNSVNHRDKNNVKQRERVCAFCVLNVCVCVRPRDTVGQAYTNLILINNKMHIFMHTAGSTVSLVTYIQIVDYGCCH